MESTSSSLPRKELSLFDAASVSVGIIIGSGLYNAIPDVARQVPDVATLFLVWGMGAIFSLAGSMCYAELATAYPAEGGDYVFLTRTFGRPLGFLFAWLQLWIVRPGTIGIMAFVFGQFASTLYDLGPYSRTIYALSAVVVLAAINVCGVKFGKRAQNVFTTAKVLGLVTVVSVAWWGAKVEIPLHDHWKFEGPNYGLALIFVLFAYTGWNEMSYVAAEVRAPEKNIPRALILGTTLVMAIYLAINGAIVSSLGLGAMQASQNLISDHMAAVLDTRGSRFVSLLICVSTLGAMNGMTFTGSRIYYAMGQEHRWFAPLGRWHPQLGTPVNSLLIEAGVTVAMLIALVGCYGPAANVFEKLLTFTGPFFWSAMGLTGLALVILRRRDVQRPRLYRVPLYPWLPLAFAAVCVWMTYNALNYAAAHWSWEGWWAAGVLLTGIVMSALVERVEPH